ncbi:glutamate-5-semialdehyde dehydrogenase [Candidatus Peribacteria bacterium]|nr:glutamate-5-semialdehyde dehydrogenase [Candidatus Peribacteria bacterium]MBT4021613.1 glutamate-5-semialdehyde dehydrogenase [Candidatus Peribacteria bacterium]MBT4474327.1 glutamate-5-semialdehyde dehydrogenase [Candidatus Peribacteria bacterium]
MTNINESLAKTKQVSRKLANLDTEKIDEVLNVLAAAIPENSDSILEANKLDLSRMDDTDPKYDRLKLTEERLNAIADDIKNVASLPSPLGVILEERMLPNELKLSKVRVPLGVIGLIYEARPNVTFDAFSLCFKSGNACVLKGGSDAKNSNQAILKVIHKILKEHDIDPSVVHLLPADREAVSDLLNANDLVDVIIPRGGRKLIDFVRENARVPVIETGAGIVHTYIDKSADTTKAKNIVLNAKTQRPSVCNALDTLVIHKDKLSDLPEIVTPLTDKNVGIFADEQSFKILDGKYNNLQLATEEHFGTEFLSLNMSIKTVSNLDEAIDHIDKFSSGHSEAVIAEDEEVVEEFLKRIDAASVLANTSTRFTDGSQFGLGAEIGISTQKLHARGPMGISELTSYKWIVVGNGQIRE